MKKERRAELFFFKKRGVLLLVGLGTAPLWLQLGAVIHLLISTAPQSWTSPGFKVLQGLNLRPPHDNIRAPAHDSEEKKPEANTKKKSSRHPSGSRHRVVSWPLHHTHANTHTRSSCTVYNTHSHPRQIKTVKKHFVKAQHGILKLIAHVEGRWLEP